MQVFVQMLRITHILVLYTIIINFIFIHYLYC